MELVDAALTAFVAGATAFFVWSSLPRRWLPAVVVLLIATAAQAATLLGDQTPRLESAARAYTVLPSPTPSPGCACACATPGGEIKLAAAPCPAGRTRVKKVAH
jgi:hypothetical protein